MFSGLLCFFAALFQSIRIWVLSLRACLFYKYIFIIVDVNFV